MTKSDLIEAMSKNSGLTKSDSEKSLKAFIETVTNALADGDSVVLTGFGTFEPRKRAEREGRNPATGEAITIAASVSAAFRQGSQLKSALNG